MSAQAAPQTEQKPAERRRFQRVAVNLLGRFMLPDYREYPCQVIDMSPGGAALITPVTGNVGDRVVAYIDHIGRVEGQIARKISGGFAMTVNAPARKRDKLAAQLTYLANRDILNLPEDRRHDRVVPANPMSTLTLDDGREYRCKIIDMSLSGAAVNIEVRPAIGTPVRLGHVRGRIIRHIESGVAIEFASVQDAAYLGLK